MEKQQHTPGPWEIDDAFKMSTVITNGTDMVICQIHGVGPGANADGRLIAAAPDLLEAHEPEREGADFLDWIADRLVHVYGESENVDFVICLRRRAAKARAAIAKATGG